jgi:2Fe-2S ferredoxin
VPKVTYIDPSDAEIMIDVDTETTVMRAAVGHGIQGIDADCGGQCACGTCHVIVEDAWIGRIDPPSEMEASMIECVDDAQPSSRLSCQIRMTHDLDGLVVRVPGSQH